MKAFINFSPMSSTAYKSTDITEATWDFAKIYVAKILKKETIRNWVHLNRLTVPTSSIFHERTDQRGSHQIFTMKFNTGNCQLLIKFKESKSNSEKVCCKLEFDHGLGIEFGSPPESGFMIKIAAKALLHTRVLKQAEKHDLVYNLPLVGSPLVIEAAIQDLECRTTVSKLVSSCSPLLRTLGRGIRKSYDLSQTV